MKKIYFTLALTLAVNTVFAQKKVELINSTEAIKKGIALNDSTQYEEALKQFNKVHNGDTNYVSALYEKAYTLHEMKNYKEAIDASKKGIALNKSNLNYFYVLLGNSLDQSEKTKEAITIYNQGIKRFPYSYLLYYNRGVSYIKIKAYKKAIADFQKALEIYPFHAGSNYQLCMLAINEKKYTRALLSASNFFLIEPTTHRARNLLVFLDNVLAGDTIPPSRGIEFTVNDDFEALNLLIKNKVALDKRYKVPTKLPLDIVKQFYLVFEKAEYDKNNSGFWNQYYLPVADKIIQEEQFEPVSYVILGSSGNEKHKEIINNYKFGDFYKWIRKQFIELRNPHTIQFNGEQLTVDYHYDKTLQAIGNLDETGENFIGVYWIINSAGGIQLRGKSINGKKEGVWKLYYENGNLQDSVFFKDDLLNGSLYSWYSSGQLKSVKSFKKGKFDGYTVFYEPYGSMNRSMHHKEGVLIDTMFYYYPNSKVKEIIPYENGKKEGLYKKLFPDGSLEYSLTYKEGKLNGVKKDYYHNHQLYQEIHLENGKSNGKSTTWYRDGQISSQGNFIEGNRVGKWISYYHDGTIKKINLYDQKGEIQKQTNFSTGGLKESQYVFKNKKITQYQFFNQSGEIVAKGDRSWGEIDYEGRNIYGAIVSEGKIKNSFQVGQWKFYNENGLLEQVTNFNDKEQLNGVTTEYYLSGEISNTKNYKNGDADGYYASYYRSGKIKEQGYYVKGKAQGKWISYDAEGNIVRSSFFVNGALSGTKTYYFSNGKKQLEEYYQDGLLLSLTSFKNDTATTTVKLNHGTGKAIWHFNNGQKACDISYIGNERYGKTTFYHGNGQISSTGNYLNGKRVGLWTWYFPNGQISYQYTYNYGQKDGKVIDKFFNGETRTAYSYKNDNRSGKSQRFDRQGKLNVTRNYKYGYLDGLAQFFDLQTGAFNHSRIYAKGRLIGYISPDKPKDTVAITMETAKIVSHYPNGKVARTYEVKNGLREGEYKVFYENGQISSKSIYKKGLYDGPSLDWYPNGTVKEKSNYVYDELDGERLLYYPNGQLMVKSIFKNGDKNGIEIHYDKAGKVTAKYRFVDDSMVEELK